MFSRTSWGSDDTSNHERVAHHFPQSFVLIVDTQALHDPANAVVVVDLRAERGRTFRVIPSAAWAVENNLSLGNLDFRDFADAADSAGVFRGF